MSQRVPQVYNTNLWSATVAATFWASGQNQGVNVPSSSTHISWQLTNKTAGQTFILTASSDMKSCTIQAQQMIPGQVDVTCFYTNADGTQASETLTICFHAESVDKITLACTG